MDDINQNQLAILTEKYIESLHEKHQKISMLLNRLHDVQWRDAQLIEALYQIIHKLSGSAGSYGFDALSDTAMQVDQLLKHRSGSVENNEEISKKITMLLNEMKTIYDKFRPSSQ